MFPPGVSPSGHGMAWHMPVFEEPGGAAAEAWSLPAGGGRRSLEVQGPWMGWGYLCVAGKAGPEAAGLWDTWVTPVSLCVSRK